MNKNLRTITLMLSALLVGLWVNGASAQTREYWVAAEKVTWNYAPSGKNQIKPKMGMGVWGKQLRYVKYRYFQYTDGSYTRKVPQPEWMGILGPQLRAVEGDTLKVHFINKADKPLSMHPHGMQYDELNDGADMKGPGAYVKPGQNFTYNWTVNHDAAPGPADPSSIVWMYHSHVDSVTEIYDGLIGTIVVTKKGMERSSQDPRPRDVDASFTNLFMIFDENGREAVKKAIVKNKLHDSHHHEQKEHHEAEEEGNLKHAINGYIFGNLTGLEVTEGTRLRWHLVAMGTEVDLHTAHWHGKTVLESGRRTDVVELLPASMKSVDMIANNPGNWLYHCHVTDHITAGMITRWRTIKDKP